MTYEIRDNKIYKIYTDRRPLRLGFVENGRYVARPCIKQDVFNRLVVPHLPKL